MTIDDNEHFFSEVHIFNVEPDRSWAPKMSLQTILVPVYLSTYVIHEIILESLECNFLLLHSYVPLWPGVKKFTSFCRSVGKDIYHLNAYFHVILDD